MDVTYTDDPDLNPPRQYPWTEQPWCTWPTRGTATRLASRRHGLYALQLADAWLQVAADRQMSYPVVVCWAGAGRYVVIERLPRLQWVDAIAPDGSPTIRTVLGDLVHTGPGHTWDAASAVTLATWVALAGIDAPALPGVRTVELDR